MDPIAGAALGVVLVAAWFYVLYHVVKGAVTAGIRAARNNPAVARRDTADDETSHTRQVAGDDTTTHP